MKFKKLLVMSALMLTGVSAAWAVDANVWTKPTPASTTGFVESESTDSYYYLYNVGAKQFFTEGNAWGTQASVGSKGLKVAFTPEGDYYLFNDFSVGKNAWMLTFFDSETAMFVDKGTQPNYYWGVLQSGNTFRLYATIDNPGWDATTNEETGEVTEHPGYREGLYVGLDVTSNAANTALSPYLAEGEGHYIDWAFVSEADYLAYEPLVEAYDAAMALKAVLDEAESINASVADQVAVYNNTASTKAELTAAATAAKAAIEKRKAELVDEQYDKATWDAPVVVTDKFIKNPDFKGDDLTTGWSGDAFGSYGPKENAEHYNKTYNTYQKVKGLNPGIYAVGVKAFYRAGNAQPALDNFMAQNAASKYAKLYATVGDLTREVPIVSACSPLRTEGTGVGSESTATYTNEETGESTTYYFPNNMEAAEYYMHQLGLYDNKLLVSVRDSVTFGVRKSSTTDGDWSIFDDFSLTYYGQGADACQNYLNEAIKEYSDIEIEEGTVYTEQYLTDYRNALQGEKKASNLDELDAVLAGLDKSKQAIDKNIELWKEWQELVDKVRSTYVIDDEYMTIEPEIGDLGDYCDFDSKDILEAAELTNEELQAEMDKVNEWVESLVEKSKLDVYDGKNMTSYITNPTFETSTTKNTGTSQGWTVDRIDGGNVTPGPIGGAGDTFLEKCGYYNGCFESWHCHKWDVWQEIKNLPVGMYELEVQGYVRCEVNGYTKGDELGENFPSPVYLYMNSAMSQFPSVYSEIPAENGIDEFQIIESWTQEEINGNYFPNSMGGAAQCFYINKDQGREGMYKTTAYGLIAQPGDVFRIGVKMDADQDWWCIWDNFKLTYREPKADIVKPVLTDAIKTIDVSQPMGKTQLETAQKANDAANAALAGDDGQAMFDALVGVYDATDAVSSSVALFKTLQKSLEDLSSAISMSNGAKETITAAEALYSQIADGIQAYSYENDDVEGLKTEIAKMITQLGLPADMASATDAAPVECTSAIVNYDYAEGNDNGWTGSAAVNAEWMDAEKFNTNYDYYQVLQGMPAGVYQVELQGFYRAGFANEDYDAYQADPAANNNAFLYAVGENADTCAVPLMRLCSQAFLTETLEDGYAWASEASQMAVPNSMATGGNMFMTYNEATEKNYYEGNVVTVKVGEDGRLVIGLKKTTLIASDWTLWNAWKLTYFGKDSQLKPDGDASGISSAKVAAVDTEYFTVGGARVSKPGKGVTIVKQKLADGSVKVKKIIVK